MTDLFISDINMTRWIAATAALILMLGSFTLLVAKLKQDRSDGLPKRLKFLESLTLSPKHRLYLVQHTGKEILILTGPHGDTIISNTTEEESV